MAEFILIATIIFLCFALLWTKRTGLNFLIKIVFILMTVFGTYLLFGPANIISMLVK
jgi:hypothetical protein